MARKSSKIMQLSQGENMAIYEQLNELKAIVNEDTNKVEPVICGSFTDW